MANASAWRDTTMTSSITTASNATTRAKRVLTAQVARHVTTTLIEK